MFIWWNEKKMFEPLLAYEVCISLVERKNADSKKCRKKNIESAFNAASAHTIHA